MRRAPFIDPDNPVLVGSSSVLSRAVPVSWRGDGRRHTGVHLRIRRAELPQRRDQREGRRDRSRFHDDLLPRTGRRTRNAGVSNNARSVLADLFFGRREMTIAPNVLRRSATGWDGCCAERVEAAVVVGKRIGLSE